MKMKEQVIHTVNVYNKTAVYSLMSITIVKTPEDFD